MVDPYAPPHETMSRPTTTYSPSGTVVETYTTPAPLVDSEHERRFRRTRDREREPHAEPAKPGLFWTIAAVGVGLLCLARLILYFAVANTLPGNQATAALFGVLGVIAVAAGLAFAALVQRGLSTPVRTALMIGAGYFATLGGPILSGFRLF